MANALLDQYKLLKEKVPTYGDNTLLSIKENKPVEPSYPSIVSPPADNTVAQLTSVNAAAPAETTPTKYFPDTVTTQALPGSPVQSQPVVASATTAATPVTTPPYTPQTEYEKYWKTPVGTSKYNMPLDQFVKVAGLAAKALNPQNPIANDLIKMGGEAYNERARREYESPNVLSQRRLHEAQTKKLNEAVPGELEIIIKANRAKGITDVESVKQYLEMKRENRFTPELTTDNNGNVYTVNKVTGEYSLVGRIGKDASGLVKVTSTNAAGDVTPISLTGKSFPVIPGADKPQQSRKGTTPSTGNWRIYKSGANTLRQNSKSGSVEIQTGPDQWRAATKEETALLEKPRAVPGEKKEKTNPFGRYTRPSTRSEAFAAIRKASPSGTSDAEINAYITKKYPELK
jgi:hypothetical protein